MKPLTVISTLAMQLYFSHVRNDDWIVIMININAENESFQSSYRKRLREIALEHKLSTTTWNVEIGDALRRRNIEIENEDK